MRCKKPKKHVSTPLKFYCILDELKALKIKL